MSYKSDCEWCKCGRCQIRFPKKFFVQHTDKCLTELVHDGPNMFINTGYIDKDILFAKAVKNPTTNENTSISQRKDIISLHLNTIKILGLHLGSIVVLHLGNKQIIKTVWPSSHIPVDSVGLEISTLQNYTISEGDIVMLHKFIGVSCHASKVELSPCKPLEFDITSQFIEYCVYHLENTFVCPGEIVEVPYYGKMKHFLVTTLEAGDGRYSYTSTTTGSNGGYSLVNDFECLNLANNKNNDNFPCSSTDYSILQSDVSLESDLNESIEGCVNTSDVTTYYSLLGDSIDIDGDGNFDDGLLTSTPLKMNKNSESLPVKSYSCCTVSKSVYYISSCTTKLIVTGLNESVMRTQKDKETLTYELVGGLTDQIRVLKEIVELPLKAPDMFKSCGLSPPSGVLLYGPSGTGKTLLAKTVASECGVHSIFLNGPDVLSRYYGETEAKLRDIFLDAQRNVPCIIFIDELDALCPKRDKVQNEFEKRVVATLLTLMDGLTTSSSGNVVVLAATNRLESLDSALRRPGRFEKEIEVGIPRSSERADILRKLFTKTAHSLTDEDIVEFADNAYGYVGADLMAVVNEAMMNSLRENFEDVKANLETTHDNESRLKNRLVVSADNLRDAFQHVRPSGLREVAIDVPKVYWSDIGGNDIVKQKLRQAIEWPLKHPEAFVRMGIDPPKGILMYGPPGCSKTLIAKALATESGLNFIAVKGPEIFSKWVGESERAIRLVFQKARTASPCVIFFDEIDAVASKRGSCEGSNVSERVLTQLLTELDGVETLNDVTLVAATNRPDIIDKALMRPGRIDRIIYIPLPDLKTRSEIFSIQLRNTPLAPDFNIDDVVAQTEGYSGAEIAAICREAALAALQENINAMHVGNEHFVEALDTVKRGISKDLIQYYAKFQQQCPLYSL